MDVQEAEIKIERRRGQLMIGRIVGSKETWVPLDEYMKSSFLPRGTASEKAITYFGFWKQAERREDRKREGALNKPVEQTK